MHTFTAFLARRAVTFSASLLNASVILESFSFGDPITLETPWGTLSVPPHFCAEEIAAALNEHRAASIAAFSV